MSASQVIEIIPHKPVTGDLTPLVCEKAFADHLNRFDHLPWLQSIKKKAWEHFCKHKADLTCGKRELWRFSTIHKAIDLQAYHLSQAPVEREQIDVVKESNWVDDFAGRLVFEDNHLLDHSFVQAELEEQGVIWLPLLEAFESHAPFIEELFECSITQLGGDALQALAIAYAHTGSFLYLPKGASPTKPFMNYTYNHTESTALLPTSLVWAEENTKASIVDVYTSWDKKTHGLCLNNSCLYAQAGAVIDRIFLQDWSKEVLHFQCESLYAEKNSTLRSFSIQIGSKEARTETQAYLKGAESDMQILSLAVAHKTQQFDQRTRQIHKAPHATSNLLYKHALLDESHTNFSGLIIVEPGAQKTDAYQTNRNLLLSNKASADSLPGLEIAADDVRCSHGATSSQINEEILFYLKSRGIPEAMAKQVLVFAFCEEIVEQIPHDGLKQHARRLIEEHLVCQA